MNQKQPTAKSTQTAITKKNEEGTSTDLPPKEILLFDLETAVRQMCTKVLAEYIERSKNNQEKLDQIKDENYKIIRRFNELDFIMHKTLQRSGNISEIQQEMLEMKQLFQVVESRVQQNLADMKTQIHMHGERLQIAEEHVYQYDKEVRRFKDYTQHFIDENLKIKGDLEKVITHNKRELTNELSEMNFKILKLKEQLHISEGTLDQHLEELRRHELMLDVFKRNIKELYESEMNLHDKKLDADQFTNAFDIFKKDLTLMRISVDDTTMTLMQTDNYLDKYLPLKIQNFITETLTNILPRRALAKLNDYIHHKYKVLKEIIDKDNGRPNLNKVEANIPVIKKIELMLQATDNYLHRNYSRMMLDQRSNINNESFFVEDDDSQKHQLRESVQQFEGTLTKLKTQNSPDKAGANQGPTGSGNNDDGKSISTISNRQGNVPSSDQGAKISDTQEGVKKKNFLIYYPTLNEEQHKDVINIRFDPKSNFVPVSQQTPQLENSQQNDLPEDQLKSQVNDEAAGAKKQQTLQKDLEQFKPPLKLTQENLQKHLMQSTVVVTKEESKASGTQAKGASSSSSKMTEIKLVYPQQQQQQSPNRKGETLKKQMKIIKVEINEKDKCGSPKKRGLSMTIANDNKGTEPLSKAERVVEKASEEEGEDDIVEEEDDDDDYEKNKLSVTSSSSSQRKCIKLSDLHDDLAEMILEAFETSKQVRSMNENGYERIIQAEATALANVEKVRIELSNQINKEIARLQLFASNIQLDFEDEFKRKNREKSDVDLILRQFKDSIEEVSKISTTNKYEIRSLASLTYEMIECLKILINMGRSDEDDRRSISLYGYKNNENNEKGADKNIFTIDRQCLGCSNQASLIIHAFKLACLSYQPQPVTYQGSQMSRESLFRLAKELLKKSLAEYKSSNYGLHFESSLSKFADIKIPQVRQSASRNTQRTLMRSQTNQSHNTISDLIEELPGQTPRNKIDNGSKKENIDLKNKAINIDSKFSSKFTQSRAHTTSRAGSRNIQMALYQTYQKDQHPLTGEYRPGTTTVNNDGLRTLHTSLSQRSYVTNSTAAHQLTSKNLGGGAQEKAVTEYNKSCGNQKNPQEQQQNKNLFNEIVKGRFNFNRLKAFPQTPRSTGGDAPASFHIRIPQTQRGGNTHPIKLEDGSIQESSEQLAEKHKKSVSKRK